MFCTPSFDEMTDLTPYFNHVIPEYAGIQTVSHSANQVEETSETGSMGSEQRSVEEIIGKLWEAEVALAQGETVAQVCRGNGVPDHTFYRWRQQYGGLRIDQARRLREMEAENARLRHAVADLTLDNQILREAAGGNF